MVYGKIYLEAYINKEYICVKSVLRNDIGILQFLQFSSAPYIHRFPTVHMVQTTFYSKICEYQSNFWVYWKNIKIGAALPNLKHICAVCFLVKLAVYVTFQIYWIKGIRCTTSIRNV